MDSPAKKKTTTAAFATPKVRPHTRAASPAHVCHDVMVKSGCCAPRALVLALLWSLRSAIPATHRARFQKNASTPLAMDITRDNRVVYNLDNDVLCAPSPHTLPALSCMVPL